LRLTRWIMAVAFSLSCVSIAAQDSEPLPVEPPDSTEVSLSVDTTAADTVIPPADTVVYNRLSQLDRYAPPADTVDFESHLYQGPTTALFKSMVIPGWGQWGNRRHIKALFFAGLDAWMVASAIDYRGKAADAFDRYDAATDLAERNSLYDAYEEQRDNRNKYTWYAVIVSFVAMFDAYVDAHMSGFPDKEREQEISLDVGPDYQGGVQASVTVAF